MKIGIVGTGQVGVTLARKFSTLGHDVFLANSRGPQSVSEILAPYSEPVIPANTEETLRNDIVILATPWLKVPEVLALAGEWNARILIDATNIFTSYKQALIVDDLQGDSGSERISRLAPGANVVKAFNTLSFDMMFAPAPVNMKRVLFVAGDEASAAHTVAGLIEQIGIRAVVIGKLADAGRMMEVRGPLSGLELFAPIKHGA